MLRPERSLPIAKEARQEWKRHIAKPLLNAQMFLSKASWTVAVFSVDGTVQENVRLWPGTGWPTAEEARKEWERSIGGSSIVPVGTIPSVSPFCSRQGLCQSFFSCVPALYPYMSTPEY